MKQVILTGIRANNDLTIGNYLGALMPIIDMARSKAGEYQVNLFVPDLHSFTTPIDHSKLNEQIMQNLRVFVAAGLPLDNPDVYIYRQSHIPAHSELTWILDCFTGMGEMNRMTQFKDKAGIQEFGKELEKLISQAEILGKNAQHAVELLNAEPVDYETAFEGTRNAYKNTLSQSQILLDYIEKLEILRSREFQASVGLFNYPVLMAADILLYNAQYVPVGEDQTQHLEFTRNIAERMNNKFDRLFTVPQSVPEQHAFFGKDQGLRIKDLIDPTKKMSKSDETGRGVIFMSDSPEAAAKKIMGATTDSLNHVGRGPDQPGITNLLDIYQFLSGKSSDEVAKEWHGQTRYGDFKKAVADVVSTFLADFHERLAQVDDSAILAKLESSEKQMNEIANATLLRAQQAVGLRAKS